MAIRKKVFVWGYWEKNLGDDLFLLSLINYFKENRKLLFSIECRGKNKVFYSKLGFKTRNINNIVFKIYKKIIGRMFPNIFYKYDCFIALGGSLFREYDDAFANNQQIEQLKKYQKFSNKCFVIGSNFGPYFTDSFLYKYKNYFSKCNLVSFRDYYSSSLFNLKKIMFYPDVVLSGFWDRLDYRENTESYICISVINLERRSHLNKYINEYRSFIIGLIHKHIDAGDKIALLSFCENEGDLIECNYIKEQINDNDIKIFSYAGDFEILGVLRNAKKIYATRFHANILSIYFERSFCPIVYDEKTYNALSTYINSFFSVDIRTLNEMSVETAFKKCILQKNIFKDESKKHLNSVNLII